MAEPDPDRPLRILFLCTGNSARSIMAEAIANKVGRGKLLAYSAGAHPKGEPHPQALKLLRSLGYPTDSLRSKSWDEFYAPDAPAMDFVVTVCDRAAEELCTALPGQPVSAHWGMPDPAEVEGSEPMKAFAFADTYRMLCARIGAFASLPFDKLNRISLQQRVDAIGQGET